MKRSEIDKGSEAFFKAIIDGMQCGIISIDTTGKVVKMNEIAKRILDIGGSETSSSNKKGTERNHISALLRPYPYITNLLLESFHMSTLPNRDETEISLNGKERKKIGYSISLVKDAKGENIGSSIFFKDLTKIEEKEEQKQLQERLAALGHMSASLAHELRNPLAAIEINASFLKRKLKEDGEAARILEGIVGDIGRLKATINESLSFIRPLDLNLLPSRLDDVVDKSILAAITENDLKKIRIEKKYETIETFLFDPELMRKALINVFRNAAEAIESHGAIDVELKKTIDGNENFLKQEDSNAHARALMNQEYARIRIRDHGKGIPKDIIEKVFYPFFTTKEKGSGLGLSFTKKVIDAHKGFIDVESQVKSGATFTIRIPMICPQREL